MASFGDRIVGAMRLDVATYEEIERDTTAMGQAIGVIVIAAVAAAVGRGRFFAIMALPMTTLATLVAYLAWSLAVFLIGTKVMPEPTTKADFAETFRVVGFATAPGIFNILGILPLIGYLVQVVVFLWMIASMVVAVRQVLDYSTTMKAVLVCVIGFVAFLIVNALLVGSLMTTMLLS
jgi:hypothetical protein